MKIKIIFILSCIIIGLGAFLYIKKIPFNTVAVLHVYTGGILFTPERYFVLAVLDNGEIKELPNYYPKKRKGDYLYSYFVPVCNGDECFYFDKDYYKDIYKSTDRCTTGDYNGICYGHNLDKFYYKVSEYKFNQKYLFYLNRIHTLLEERYKNKFKRVSSFHVAGERFFVFLYDGNHSTLLYEYLPKTDQLKVFASFYPNYPKLIDDIFYINIRQ